MSCSFAPCSIPPSLQLKKIFLYLKQTFQCYYHHHHGLSNLREKNIFSSYLSPLLITKAHPPLSESNTQQCSKSQGLHYEAGSAYLRCLLTVRL